MAAEMILVTKRREYKIRLYAGKYTHETLHDVTVFAEGFVKQSIVHIMEIIIGLDGITNGDDGKSRGKVSKTLSYFGVEWPTCGNITVRNAFQCVKQEMKMWNKLPALQDWMFHVDLVSLESEGKKEIYKYEVVWSVPTAAYPVPIVTVSVYFYITVNRTHPPHFPIEVTYHFEGNRFMHRLDMVFRPKWLYDVFDMKAMLFETFTF